MTGPRAVSVASFLRAEGMPPGSRPILPGGLFGSRKSTFTTGVAEGMSPGVLGRGHPRDGGPARWQNSHQVDGCPPRQAWAKRNVKQKGDTGLQAGHLAADLVYQPHHSFDCFLVSWLVVRELNRHPSGLETPRWRSGRVGTGHDCLRRRRGTPHLLPAPLSTAAAGLMVKWRRRGNDGGHIPGIA